MRSPTLTPPPSPPQKCLVEEILAKTDDCNNNTKLFLCTSYLLPAVSLLRSLRLGKEPCVMTPRNGCQGN